MVSVKKKVDYVFCSFKKEELTFYEVRRTQKTGKNSEALWIFLSEHVLEIKSLYRLEMKKSEEDNVI